ncbi:MAG: glycogen/starch/alpha-glucan phosphorylase [Christensenellaceae bacterium]|jgi:starch phosphorylase
MRAAYTKEQLKDEILGKLKRVFGTTLENASKEQIYKACALTMRDVIVEEWADTNAQVAAQGLKRVYYLSAEFLIGRALVNNMINLCLLDEYREVLAEMGIDLDDIEEQEADAGLGNGGLGRLAACFLDSLSTLNLPATGCSIRYEYGLFRQKIVDGEQTEVDDNWMETGNVWEVARPEEQVEVRFGGEIEEVWTSEGLHINHKDYYSVLAIPYDYPVMGYASKMPASLRLWSAKARSGLDMDYFNRGDYSRAIQERELAEIISKCLYPGDHHEQGKQLRLKQFYFFTSATIQYIVKHHKRNFGDLHTLPNYYAVQINDTHPTLAIPELIRILVDEEHIEWEDAVDIAQNMFSYANHTVMAEALECWNEGMFKELLPRIYQIITKINQELCMKLWEMFPGERDRILRMAIIAYDEIRMANLCIAMCKKVNGVSKLHGDILKSYLFRDFFLVYPEKFLSVTNGITHRRWLAKANQPLTKLIEKHIGRDFLQHYKEMDKIKELVENEEFLAEFMDVKKQNKIALRNHLKKHQNIDIDENTIFDVHAKRIHEYKRQLLKVLHIIHLYNTIKEGRKDIVPPSTFIFAGKAFPGYQRAKEIIRLILAVGRMINNDPDTRDIIKVVFIENYSVSEAEVLMPAADISEQISITGYEASGTGNMKFMMNGAVTLGTMDGANVEIFEAVGPDNIFIFGGSAQEIYDMDRLGTYKPADYYEQNSNIRNAMNRLVDGSLPVPSDRQFTEIYQSLLFDSLDKADKYFLLYDFDSYSQAFDDIMTAYKDAERWKRLAAMNTASSSVFCADRAIEDYNREIWRLLEKK